MQMLAIDLISSEGFDYVEVELLYGSHNAQVKFISYDLENNTQNSTKMYVGDQDEIASRIEAYEWSFPKMLSFMDYMETNYIDNRVVFEQPEAYWTLY